MPWKIVTVVDLKNVPEAVSILEGVGRLVQVGKDRVRLLEELPDCDAYFGGGELKLDKEALDRAPNLKVVGSPATGKDHLDLDEINRRGITLIHLAEEYDLLRTFTATSEMAFTLLLALIRQLPPALEDAKQGVWSRERYTGFQLFGKTLGVLGLGRLGTISAKIGQGFSMNVLACDTQPKSVPGVTMVNFETLLREADVLTIHIHLTPDNIGLMNAEAFSKMKPTSILLNTSRGGIVSESALVDALEQRKIAGAGLDVIDGEWLPQGEQYRHPLLAYARSHNNLLISPHIGGATHESIAGARIFMANKLKDYIMSQAL